MCEHTMNSKIPNEVRIFVYNQKIKVTVSYEQIVLKEIWNKYITINDLSKPLIIKFLKILTERSQECTKTKGQEKDIEQN